MVGSLTFSGVAFFCYPIISFRFLLVKRSQNWKYSIANALAINEFKKRLTNAVAQANNNVIETLINASFGLVNFDRMRKRVLFISNSKKTR